MKLKEKVAVVTGAGSGIGQAIAVLFSREGARVVIAELDETKAHHTKDLIHIKGGQAIVEKVDVSDSTSVQQLFKAIDDKGWSIDILVNNAGNAGSPKPVHEITDAQWADRMVVHLNGTFYCTREAIKRMLPHKRGTIINMGSVAGFRGLAGAAQYSAAKGGIMAFTKGVAQEMAPQGIRVNCIAPGWIDTPMLKGLSDDIRGGIAKMTPLGRMGTPEEVAAVAVFLASDDASFIIGQIISPNGGLFT